MPNNSVLKAVRLTVYSTTDKGDWSMRPKDKNEAEYGNMNAILAELRSHREEFEALQSQSASLNSQINEALSRSQATHSWQTEN